MGWYFGGQAGKVGRQFFLETALEFLLIELGLGFLDWGFGTSVKFGSRGLNQFLFAGNGQRFFEIFHLWVLRALKFIIMQISIMNLYIDNLKLNADLKTFIFARTLG